MLLVLTAGIALWIVYGVMIADFVIMLANSVSLLFLLGLLYFQASAPEEN